MKRLLVPALALGLAAPTSGCFLDDLTAGEMRAALLEAVENGQVQQLENGVIEITTDFTIGDAVEDIRQHIHDVLAACSATEVTVTSEVGIAIDFGPAADPCNYKGKSYSGQVDIIIARTGDSIDVEHTYTDLSNGTYTLNGVKDVSWTDGGGTVVNREVSDDLGWDGPNGHVDHQSSRTMTFFDWLGGPTQRISIDGDHDWQRDGDDWNLSVDMVELQLDQPVPHDGSYTLTIPSGKQATMSFERVDDDTISVTITGGRKDHVFHVTKSGVVTDET